MGDTALSRSGWIAAQWLKALGMPGLAGLVLIMSALAAFIGFVLPAEAKLERTTSEVEDLQNRLKRELVNPVDRALPAESNLTSFYKSFPPEQSAVKELGKVYQSANSESLLLTQGEYKFTREKEGHLESYQIIMPVRGSYIQIRKFIAKVMNSVPTAALDGISFRREAIGGTDLEAKIQFSIFVGTV